MTRFFSSVVFCLFLLGALAFLFTESSNAKVDIAAQLLALPAPPPPNPFVRQAGFGREGAFDRRNPPKDDAPIDELMDYWRAQSEGYRGDQVYGIVPSARSLDRILGELQKEPSLVTSYLSVLRDSDHAADVVKQIYDNMPIEGEGDGRSSIKTWLTMNSPYFAGQLAKTASRIGDRNEYVNSQDELLALVKHDWDGARPTVDRLYGDAGQPVSRVLATWALYRHALDEDSMGDIDRYREELKKFVEDKKASPGMRDLAMDALVREKDWSGRDDWYFSLLEDETLGELRVNGSLYTGLTTLINLSPPEKYADKMIELVKSTNPAVRAAAARNLTVILDAERPDVVRALLPWLEDPAWAKDVSNSRAALVTILQSIKMPESVPGLIAAIDEEQTLTFSSANNSNTSRMSNSIANAANMAANAMAYAANDVSEYTGPIVSSANRTMSNSAGGFRTVVQRPLRGQAIGALGMQGDMRAAPVLRRIIGDVETYERAGVIKAMLLCKGFTVAEQADALEHVAKNEEGAERGYGNANVANMMSTRPVNISPIEIKELLGAQLVQTEDPGEPLIREVVARISLLERRDPTAAATLRSYLLNWKGPAINALLLKDLKDGQADMAVVVKLLTARKEIREKQSGDVHDARRGSPAAAAVAACLMESETDYAAILDGDNAEAKTVLFACGRLIRAKIPVQRAVNLLGDKNKQLAAAAELYLESEDSPAARSAVLSIHPNEAKILGATTGFWPAQSSESGETIAALFASVTGAVNEYGIFQYGDFKRIETRLQNEVKTDTELLGVYSYANDIVRIYKDRSVYSWEEDEARFRERTMTREEFEYFTGYISHHKADELAPFLACVDECEPNQLLMLGKHGGRRVFVSSTRTPEFFAGLDAMFKEMRVPPSKLHYELEKGLPGLEILFADDDKAAQAVWKNGSDMRLLIADKLKRLEIDREIEEAAESLASEGGEEGMGENIWTMQRKRQFDNYGWFKFESGSLRDRAAQPEQIEFLQPTDNFAVPSTPGQWKAKTAGVELRVSSEGLFKIAGGKMTKIGTGYYVSPVVTPNGRWGIVTKYGDSGTGLVRVNLSTNKEFPAAREGYSPLRAIAFVPSVGRVLLATQQYGEYGEDEDGERYNGTTSYFWLDPDTGITTPAKGHVAPLAQQTIRSLQPAQNAFEFWVAEYDTKRNETNVGIYNTKTFLVRRMLTAPKIKFDSMDMWADEAAGKIYVVYNGHLLSLPIAAKK